MLTYLRGTDRSRERPSPRSSAVEVPDGYCSQERTGQARRGPHEWPTSRTPSMVGPVSVPFVPTRGHHVHYFIGHLAHAPPLVEFSPIEIYGMPHLDGIAAELALNAMRITD